MKNIAKKFSDNGREDSRLSETSRMVFNSGGGPQTNFLSFGSGNDFIAENQFTENQFNTGGGITYFGKTQNFTNEE